MCLTQWWPNVNTLVYLKESFCCCYWHCFDLERFQMYVEIGKWTPLFMAKANVVFIYRPVHFLSLHIISKQVQPMHLSIQPGFEIWFVSLVHTMIKVVCWVYFEESKNVYQSSYITGYLFPRWHKSDLFLLLFNRGFLSTPLILKLLSSRKYRMS